jgi:hypothetical protein
MVVNYVVIMIVLLLFAGLGLDVGMLEWRYLQMSAAARAAAVSGSVALQRGWSSSLVISTGQAAAALNGFTNNTNGVTVTISNPPAAGPYSGNSYSVRATITQSVPTTFMNFVGFPKVSMSAYYDHPGALAVSMTSSFNVNAIVTDSGTVNGGMDGSSYAYSANCLDPVRTSNGLGALLSWRGNLFVLGVANGMNGTHKSTVTLTQGNFEQLLILAATGYGPLTGQAFVVTYTDNSTATTSFSMSDWNVSPTGTYTNEVVVQQTAYRDYSNTGPAGDGNQPLIFGYTINLDNTKKVKSVTLPNINNVVVFAMDLVP